MARRSSEAEKQMHAVGAKADEWVAQEFPNYLEILHSWSGGDLVLDIKDSGGGWHRKLWVLDDDMEISAIRGLA